MKNKSTASATIPINGHNAPNGSKIKYMNEFYVTINIL